MCKFHFGIHFTTKYFYIYFLLLFPGNFCLFVHKIIYLFRNLKETTDWLSPFADHSYTNVETTKRLHFNGYIFWGFLVLLGIFSLVDGWYFSHNSSLVLSCTIFRRPSWHRLGFQISAEFMFDIFGCDLVWPQVPEYLTDPIKKEGWIRYTFFGIY